MALLIALAVLLAGLTLFSWRRLLTYLHVFQQEEYDGPRFLSWMARTRTVDTRASAALIALGVAMIALPGVFVAPAVLGAAGIVLAMLAFRERDPRRDAKKKLALTERAKRILIVACVVLIVLTGALIALGWPLIATLVAIQAVPLALVAGNLALSPFETRVQRKFWQEAHDKLERLKPLTIGITGSYGKTSVKHILGHLLETQAPALVTPGSVNTPMGIARIVRERLAPNHRFFLAEMGAYGPGSIDRLCQLAPPDLAIVTAVGPAHYERFKSLDVVASAKFELPAHARARGGKSILASVVTGFPAAKAFLAARADDVIVVGPDDGASLRIAATRETATGVEADIVWNGATYTLAAPLHGLHHAANMAIAFAAAASLGADPADLVVALKTTPQIAHRLEVKPQADGSILVDDAYNSNPTGFAAALETLDRLVKPGGRRILVTPGMVELGALHDAEHARLGTAAAAHVDVLLPVIPARIESFVAAFRTAGPDRPVVPCATFAQAQAWLAANVRAGDVVLLENDLPDLYERPLRL